MNIKITATHVGFTVREDGVTHQSIEDMGLIREIPGMVFVCQVDGVETAAAKQAMQQKRS